MAKLFECMSLMDLWCSDIAPIDLNWDGEGIQEFQCTFQYDYWRVQGGTTGDAGGV
jgi:hypothetical protein